MTGLLAGKTILITGIITDASIAFSAAKVAQEQGAKVIITGIPERLRLIDRIAKRLPQEVPPAIPLDITDEEYLGGLADKVREHVEANAGALPPGTLPIDERLLAHAVTAVLDDEDRALLRTFVINKFRGDADILAPGLAEITARTGMPSFGVLPWLTDVWLDSEDAVSVGAWGSAGTGSGTDDGSDESSRLLVAVVRLPRTSNATDVDALAAEPGVDVRVTRDSALVREADLVQALRERGRVAESLVLPGEGHAIVMHESKTRLCAAMIDWFDTHLGHVAGEVG